MGVRDMWTVDAIDAELAREGLEPEQRTGTMTRPRTSTREALGTGEEPAQRLPSQVSGDTGKLGDKVRSVGPQRSGGHGAVSGDTAWTEWSGWAPGAGGISEVRGRTGQPRGQLCGRTEHTERTGTDPWPPHSEVRGQR